MALTCGMNRDQFPAAVFLPKSLFCYLVDGFSFLRFSFPILIGKLFL